MTEKTVDRTATREERLAIIRQFVAERLFRKPEEVTLKSRLIADLGADSLDFVDMQFQLENRFALHFEDGEFFDFTYRWVGPDGSLRPEVVEQLSTIVPDLGRYTDREQIPVGELLNLITVETLLRIVEEKSS